MSSARRRARAGGGVARAVGDVPPELANPDDPVWADADAVADLADVYSLEYVEPNESFLRDPLFERFKAFRMAYAERYKLLTDDNGLDVKRMKAAGIYSSSRGPRWQLTPTGDVVPIKRGRAA